MIDHLTKILYIGNFLSGSGKTAPPAELLLSELGKYFNIGSASSFASPGLRLLHMISSVVWGKLLGVNVVIVDVFSSKAFWYAFSSAEISHLLRIPVILVLHGGRLPDRFIKSPRIARRMFFTASKIISPSRYLQRSAYQTLGVEVKVIGNPLRLEAYPMMSKSFTVPHLLWVRTFHEVYNPAMAIAVCAMLTKYFHDIRLTMVGPDADGSMDRMKDLVKAKGLVRHVHMTGLLSKEEWIKESSAANVFINTTRADNTPVSVLEALALGLPVVTTNVGGIPDLLDHENTALLVEDNDCEAMVKSVLRIMNDISLRERLIMRGRALAEKMDLKVIGKEWKMLIDEVVS